MEEIRHLDVLKNAHAVLGSRVGVAAVRDEVYEAFVSAMHDPELSRAHLERLLYTASPAGRVYALLLFEQRGFELSLAALKSLMDDVSEVTLLAGGCTGWAGSVGELAARITAGDNLIDFKPIRVTEAMVRHRTKLNVEWQQLKGREARLRSLLWLLGAIFWGAVCVLLFWLDKNRWFGALP
jgi:hypothetical protein